MFLIDSGFLEERGIDDPQPRYNIVKANECVLVVDPIKPDLMLGQLAVYPFQDEATDLLRIAGSLNKSFDLEIDPFRGGGHSTLPILKAGIAKKAKSGDINPRAQALARLNARINGLEAVTQDFVKRVEDNTIRRDDDKQRVLFVANPPFALAVNGVNLDPMRDGGINGLRLTDVYLDNSIVEAQTGDIIMGVAYSRMKPDGTVELEQSLQGIIKDRGTWELKLVEGAKLWRGSNSKKEQPNPMPLTDMYKKAKPDDTGAIHAYNLAAQTHTAEGWSHLGYFQYVIRVNKSQEIERLQDAAQKALGEIST